MNRIIELSDNDYKALKEEGVQNHIALADSIIARSMPYEPQKEIVPVCKVTFDKEQLQEMVDKAVAELVADNKRSEGKWVYKEFDEKTGIRNSYFCSKCGCPQGQVYINFCGQCGADMKGDANGSPIKTVTNAEEAEAYPISEDIRKAKKIAEIFKKYGSEEEE